MEVRQLASSRPITVLNGSSGQSGITYLILTWMVIWFYLWFSLTFLEAFSVVELVFFLKKNKRLETKYPAFSPLLWWIEKYSLAFCAICHRNSGTYSTSCHCGCSWLRIHVVEGMSLIFLFPWKDKSCSCLIFAYKQMLK